MKKTTFLLLWTIIINNVYSQDKYVNFLTPQSYEFIRYGNTPVSYFTGEANVQIPIYTYKDKDFEIPIFLSYNSSGFIPNKREGIVGLNWFLNAGGVLTRNINGQPDDQKGLPTQMNPTIPHGLYYGIKNNLAISSATKSSIFNFVSGTVINNTGTTTTTSGGTIVDDEWVIGGCELQSDDYNFTMPGHAGRFVLENNGNVHCLGKENDKVDLTEMGITSYSASNIDSSKIVITTDDGYKYYFGGDKQYLEIVYHLGVFSKTGTDLYSTHPSISAWLLHKIVAPDGRTVTFNYKTFNDEFGGHDVPSDRQHYILNNYLSANKLYYSDCTKFFLGSKLCQSSSTSLSTFLYSELEKTAYLESIVINDDSIKFAYSPRPYYFYSDSSKYANFDQKNLLLKNIFIKEKNDTVRNYSLKYAILGGSYGKRIFLDTVSEKGSRPYILSYYNTSIIPDPMSASVDYWGFWNGIYSSDNLIPACKADSSGGDFSYTDNTREADLSKCSVGLLKTLTYPTGGSSTFYYEGNTYSKRLERRYITKFLPALFDTIGNAGGARISKIVDNDGKNNAITRRFYYSRNYPDTTKSSGILLSWPRYFYWWTYINKGVKQEVIAIQSNSFNVNYYPGEKFIQYPEVTEVISPSNGYTKYKYTSYFSNPDSVDYVTKTINEDYQQHVTNILLYDNYVGIKLNDKSFERGEPYSVSTFALIGNKYKLIKQDSTIEFTNAKNYTDRYVAGAFNTGAIAASYKEYYYPFLIKKKLTTTYDSNGNNPVSLLEKYSYNDQNYIKSKVTITSDGDSVKTNYWYPQDYGTLSSFAHTSPIQGIMGLVNSNIVNNPIEIMNYKSNQIVNANLNIYQSNSLERPRLQIKKKIGITTPVSDFTSSHVYINSKGLIDLYYDSRYYNFANYDLYDTLENIIQVHNENDQYSSFIWGYNQTLPIAKVDNATTSLTSIGKSIGYLDFEEQSPIGATTYPGSDYWSITGGSYSDVNYTGKKSLYLNQVEYGLARVFKPDQKDQNRSYTFSAMIRADVDNNGRLVLFVKDLSGKTISYSESSVFSTNASKWKYYYVTVDLASLRKSKSISDTTTLTLSCYTWNISSKGGYYIDNVRLCPNDAQLYTYTYDPLRGMTSQTDPNNVSIYYEYDKLSRLYRLKDRNGNILKQFEYNFAQ
jgi:hypothetical protein